MAACSTVASTHHQVMTTSTRRAPIRSANSPPGNWHSAYPSRNALKTLPISTCDRWNSSIRSAPATDRLTRHR